MDWNEELGILNSEFGIRNYRPPLKSEFGIRNSELPPKLPSIFRISDFEFRIFHPRLRDRIARGGGKLKIQNSKIKTESVFPVQCHLEDA